MSASIETGAAQRYYVPAPSHWPVLGSVALLLTLSGAVMAVNSIAAGLWTVGAGLLVLFYTLFGWFGDVVSESELGKYNRKVDFSFRWSMGWFIFSEVMFFAAFFGALFYARTISGPWLGDIDHRAVLWPDFNGVWPHAGPAGTVEPFQTMGPFWIPTINTALLLSSGVTITWAHHALRRGHRGQLQLGLLLTIVLGVTFLSLQIHEYSHAYQELNLKLTSGIYGSTFYMLTGFHGFHVTLGAIMLTVILARCVKGHFKPDHHFGFEAVAWYWHFVDVVWLGLYIVVYWL